MQPLFVTLWRGLAGVIFYLTVRRVTLRLFITLVASDCSGSSPYNFHLRHFVTPPPAEDKAVTYAYVITLQVTRFEKKGDEKSLFKISHICSR